MTDSSSPAQAEKQPFDLGATYGFLVLRIWLAARSIITGIEKFAGTSTSDAAVDIAGETNEYGLTETVSSKSYGFEFYQGVPQALYSKFSNEPLIPDFALSLYNILLGPALLLLGFTLLIGVATRTTLFLMGLMYTSLTVGLILLKQDAGIAWLASHIILVAMALFTVKHNRFELFKKF
ncbi:MAG: hypothetical protein AAF649_03470 [Verrucomicrobiota bacterium]